MHVCLEVRDGRAWGKGMHVKQVLGLVHNQSLCSMD